MNSYIKNLISINKTSVETIASLEEVIAKYQIEDDKDKANFGNLCLILKANRIIADATEAMLANDDVLKDDNGDYYQKIKTSVPPSAENKTGSDTDIDNKSNE